MRFFDYSFFKRRALACKTCFFCWCQLQTFQRQEAIHQEQYPDVFTELESIARIQSVKNSYAIEGIVTSDQRIIEIVNQSSAPLNHDEREIAGYRDALALIHDNYRVLDIRGKRHPQTS